MKSMYTLRLVTLSSALLFAFTAISQNIARIQIQKQEHGETTEETREVVLEDGQDIESLLKEMGILDEFGKLKEGQSFQISMSRTGKGEDAKNLDMSISSRPEGAGRGRSNSLSFSLNGEAFLGVMLKENEGTDKHPVITEVIPGTCAEAAGLEAGDTITEIDGKSTHSVDEVIAIIREHSVGDKVKVEVLRHGEKIKVSTQLGTRNDSDAMFHFEFDASGLWEEMEKELKNMEFQFDGDSIMIICPSAPDCALADDSMTICQPFSWKSEGFELKETAFLGVSPAENPSDEGVRIEVLDGSSAKEMGLLSGDVIKSVNGTTISHFEALATMIDTMSPGDNIAMEVVRDGSALAMSGQLGKREMSINNDIRIFRDFNGMDEGGNYIFDYEFDMGAEDVEIQMESLIELLDQQREKLELETERLKHELEERRAGRSTLTVTIEIESITAEDLERINRTAAPKLENKNDLGMESISFFPNPSDGILNLNFTLQSSGDLSIVLYDSNGSKVFIEERNNFSGRYTNTIDISEHADGTYYLQIMQGGKSYSKKIVKG